MSLGRGAMACGKVFSLWIACLILPVGTLRAVQVAAGEHTVILNAGGRIMSSGPNTEWQLGLGDSFSRRVFATAPGEDWSHVAVGGDSTFACKTDGSLWYSGGLPLLPTTQVRAFARLGEDADWKTCEAGLNHAMALKLDGSLWIWGKNTDGQLGSADSKLSVPTRLGSASDWKTIAAGQSHCLAIKTDGSLWAWGKNTNGQLGIGNNSSQYAPVRIGTGTNWKSVAAGGAHSMAIREDGSLWTWGANTKGQLGISSYTSTNVPVQVGTATVWASVAAGDEHSLAVLTHGNLLAWGGNGFGQLGKGDTTTRNAPIRIGTLSNWAAVEAGNDHSVAVQSDGKVWVWGRNDAGQLGFPPPNFLVPGAADLTGRPQIVVTNGPYDSEMNSSNATLSFGDVGEGAPVTLEPKIWNAGDRPLMVQSIQLPAGFSAGLSTPLAVESGAPVPLPVTVGESLTGELVGDLTIATDDAGLLEFAITLSARVLAQDEDTDEDGMNDALELQWKDFGFRWNTANPTLVAALRDQVHWAGLYTEEQLGVLDSVRVPDPVSGRIPLVMRVESSGDLSNFEAVDLSAARIDAGGLLRVPLPPRDDAGFFRMAVEPPPATP